MKLLVYSPEFERIGFVGTAQTVRLTRRLCRAGVLELTIHPSAPYAETLERGNLLMLDGDGGKCAFIEYVEDRSEGGMEIRHVRGRTPECLLERRLTVPPGQTEQYYEGWDRARGPAETVMKHYVTRHCVDPEFEARAFPGFSVAPDLGRGPEVPWQSRFEPVSDVLEAMFAYTRLGYSVRFDPAGPGLVFDVTAGRNLTASQSENPRMVFSVTRGNINLLSYVEDALGMATAGYAGGEGSGEDRLIYKVGGGSGYQRYEAFLDCGGAQIDELEKTGQAKLAALATQFYLDADIIPGAGAGVCALGDTVSVIHERRGTCLDAQITEITEVYEPGGTTVAYVFGSRSLSTAGRIRGAKEVR